AVGSHGALHPFEVGKTFLVRNATRYAQVVDQIDAHLVSPCDSPLEQPERRKSLRRRDRSIPSDQSCCVLSTCSLAAMLTRSGSLRAFILRIMRVRCPLTVTSLMPSSPPTCLFRRPRTTSAIT